MTELEITQEISQRIRFCKQAYKNKLCTKKAYVEALIALLEEQEERLSDKDMEKEHAYMGTTIN